MPHQFDLVSRQGDRRIRSPPVLGTKLIVIHRAIFTDHVTSAIVVEANKQTMRPRGVLHIFRDGWERMTEGHAVAVANYLDKNSLCRVGYS